MSKLTLGRREYTVVCKLRHGYALRGARGAAYHLVQNLVNPELFCLIPAQSPGKTEWYRRDADGSFVHVR